MKEPHQLQGRVPLVKGLHPVIGNVQDDAVMAGVLCCHGFCHVNQVGVHQNQVPGAGHVFPVVEEKKTLPFYDVKNLVLVVEMLYPHVELAVADHLLQGNPLNLSVKCHLFHMSGLSSCSCASMYSIVVINQAVPVNR